jgi:hypothetical protein
MEIYNSSTIHASNATVQQAELQLLQRSQQVHRITRAALLTSVSQLQLLQPKVVRVLAEEREQLLRL